MINIHILNKISEYSIHTCDFDRTTILTKICDLIPNLSWNNSYWDKFWWLVKKFSYGLIKQVNFECPYGHIFICKIGD